MGLYSSQFVDLDGKLYTVDLEGDEINGTKQFTLGGTPFVTEMDTEDDTVYSPIKGQGATVTMVTADYPFDLYNSTLQGRKCILYSGTDTTPRQKVEWVGYVTPCMFDMGFNTYLEEIEIECVDGISMLKDLPYRKETSEERMLTFSYIVRRILNSCDCYKYLYVSDNVQMKKNGTEPILDIFNITEQNFFEQKDDMYTLDDEVAWKCYDVLLEICRYMGYTLIAQGDEVFMLDYDAIRQGINSYHKYSLTNLDESPTRVTLTDTKYIDAESYAESSSTVSLDEVYNKVKVKDEFYTFDEIFPELGDEKFEENITKSENGDWNFENGRDLVMKYYFDNNVNYKGLPYDNFHRTSKKGKDISFQIFLCKGWKKNTLWLCIVQLVKAPMTTQHKYGNQLADRTQYYADKKQGWGEVLELQGATQYRFWHREISSSDYNKWRANYHSDWWAQTEEKRYEAWKTLLDQDPQNKVLTPYILLKNASAPHISRDKVYDYPYLTMKTDGNGVSFGGEGAYLIIQGSVCYHDRQDTPFPMADGANNGSLKRDVDCKRGEEMYLPCRLKWGDLYWDGEGWTRTQSDFPLRWGIPNQGRHYNRSNYSNKKIFDKFVEFIDTAQSVYNCTERGVYVPCPEEENLQGGIEFTIYANRDMWGDSYHGHWDGDSRYYSRVYVLKGFKIKAVIDNGILDDMQNDSDTIFTNHIPNGAVNEMDEIIFKVCTYDYKKPNYSSVYYIENGQSKYVQTTFNKALESLENGTQSTEQTSPNMRQEEHLVFKMVTQCEKPRKVFECTLRENDFKPFTKLTDKTLEGTFIIQEIGRDYRYGSTTLKLTEKA